MPKKATPTDPTHHYEGAYLEEIRHMFKALQEGQQSMAHVPMQLQELKNDMQLVKNKLDASQAVVKIHSADSNNHNQRITKLEFSAT